MAAYPVKYLHSEMRGAPPLKGAAGALIGLLDACLVNGFGADTVTSIVVSGGVATITMSSGAPFAKGSIILVAGATPSALNGEQRVISETTTTCTFATSAADGTATGSITVKYAPAGWEKVFTGTKNADFAPNSPVHQGTPTPIFELDSAGWGGSWVAGNVLFVDTVGASYPIDVIRSVQPGTPPGGDYSFLLEQRGDVDTPPASPFP